jgi:hypothetical protein
MCRHDHLFEEWVPAQPGCSLSVAAVTSIQTVSSGPPTNSPTVIPGDRTEYPRLSLERPTIQPQ